MTARVPPHSLDAERSLLGGILLDKQAFDDVIELVAPQDFYRDAHRKAFEAMSALAGRNEPIDRVSLKAELVRSGDLEAVGGEDAIDGLDKETPIASDIAHYAKIIREKGQLRRTIEAATSIAQSGYQQHGATSEFLDSAQRKILDATEQQIVGAGPESVKPIVLRAFQEIERDYQRGAEVTGLESGLIELDRKTAGWQVGDLILGHYSVVMTERYAHLRPDLFPASDLGTIRVDLSAADAEVVQLGLKTGSSPRRAPRNVAEGK